MIDSFPFDKWSDDISAFWTFWSEDRTGTYIMTVLGIIVMLAAFVYWTWLENRKLQAQGCGTPPTQQQQRSSVEPIHHGYRSCCMASWIGSR